MKERGGEQESLSAPMQLNITMQKQGKVSKRRFTVEPIITTLRPANLSTVRGEVVHSSQLENVLAP